MTEQAQPQAPAAPAQAPVIAKEKVKRTAPVSWMNKKWEMNRKAKAKIRLHLEKLDVGNSATLQYQTTKLIKDLNVSRDGLIMGGGEVAELKAKMAVADADINSQAKSLFEKAKIKADEARLTAKG